MSPRTLSKRLAAGWALFSAVVTPKLAWAQPGKGDPDAPLACAIVRHFDGVAQVLDESRTRFREIGEKSLIPCGSWVSVDQGWVELRHRNGYIVRLGPYSFVQFVSNGDPVVLFRGQAYVEAGSGTGELRIVTANGRARLGHASGIVLFDTDSERTQLIAVHGRSSLENRFEITRRSDLAAGEASSLDFKLLRVIPTVPRPVSVTSLQEKLAELHVPAQERSRALASARDRQNRRFVSAGDKDREPAERKPGRRLASLKTRGRGAASRPGSARKREGMTDEQLRAHMIDRMVAGQADGEKILFPNRYYGKAQRARLEVRVIEDKGRKRAGAQSPEEAEKRKLIEELSAIKVE